MNRKFVFIIGSGLILLAFVSAVFLYKNQQSGMAGHNQGVSIREGAAVKGPVDAKVTIVEFLDPACETCSDFYPLVKKFIDQYPGKVRVMVRYAPLHNGSDQVVKMLEAAHRQGKFWQALELLFSTQNRWVANHQSQPMRARSILNSLDVDQDRLNIDMGSSGVLQVIQQDIQDGQTLNIRATPEFFVNGRPMPSFGYKQLSQLVSEAVAEAY